MCAALLAVPTTVSVPVSHSVEDQFANVKSDIKGCYRCVISQATQLSLMLHKIVCHLRCKYDRNYMVNVNKTKHAQC